MSRTYKDSKIRRELNKALIEKKSGPHKEKRWIICPECKGEIFGEYLYSEGEDYGLAHHFAKCKTCKGEGIVYV